MDSKVVFAGALSFISLPDIFQTLGSNNSTGRLQITSQYVPNPGVVYFDKGDPVHATMGPTNGLDAIYALFGWSEGNFEFFEEEVKIGRVVNNSRMQIILDALRMLDDGLIEKIGPTSLPGAQAGQKKDGKNMVLPVIKGPLVDYVYVISEDSFFEGGRIVKEGGHGRWIWVILEGMVDVTRATENGTMAVARLGEGCFIGGFASLLRRQAVRTATVTAASDVQLGVVDADILSRQYSGLTSDFKKILISLDGRLRRMTDLAVELSMKKSGKNKLPADTKTIIKRGSSKQELFAITEGETYVVGQTPKGDLPLLTLKENDVFGYLPFMDIGHEPRFASILAPKDVQVRKLDSESLRKEYDQLSGTLKNLIYNVGSCISATTGLACHLRDGK
jgi:CRP-like cAMP-binding protein